MFVCPIIDKSQDYNDYKVGTLYLSKKETVKDLREKITRINNQATEIHNKVNMMQARLWKLDPRTDLKQIIQQVIESSELLVIKAKKLEDSVVLEVIKLNTIHTFLLIDC